MIWIRSQKGTSLVEVSHVKICEALSNGKVSGYTIDYDTPDATFELGKYSTKEKALKVMDLIQERIVRIKTVKLLENKIPNEIISVIGNKIDEYVFQMPQDDEVQS